ncbi:MAG TPA: lipopolysaccharide assembly protein LapA domain-containing protein [Acidimicrobiales bacterium]|nr:lipopolysaccharide assembly protein LapA domain-containing protein [Acidimicrobiales bacterium]
MSSEPNKQPTPQPNKQPSEPKPPRSPGSWVAIACGMILLVVLLVFILQNSKEVKVSFFMVHWRAPLAVDLLFATVLGGLIVFAAGSVHIIQLRRLVRHHQAGGAAGTARHPGDPEESHRKD